jgi:hypothetical protein
MSTPTTHTYIDINPSYHAQLQGHYSDGHCLHIRTPAGILTVRISTDSSGRDISAHLHTVGAARTTFGTWLHLSAPACVRVLRTVTAHSHLWIGSAWLELPAEHTDAAHRWLRTHIGEHCAEHTTTFAPTAEAA